MKKVKKQSSYGLENHLNIVIRIIDTYFNDGESTEKVIQDWADIHFLSIDKYYTDGVMKTIDINLSGITPKYNETEWNILKSNYRSQSKTFSFWKHKVLYTILLI